MYDVLTEAERQELWALALTQGPTDNQFAGVAIRFAQLVEDLCYRRLLQMEEAETESEPEPQVEVQPKSVGNVLDMAHYRTRS